MSKFREGSPLQPSHRALKRSDMAMAPAARQSVAHSVTGHEQIEIWLSSCDQIALAGSALNHDNPAKIRPVNNCDNFQ